MVWTFIRLISLFHWLRHLDQFSPSVWQLGDTEWLVHVRSRENEVVRCISYFYRFGI